MQFEIVVHGGSRFSSPWSSLSVALSEKSPDPTAPTFLYRTTTVVKAKSNGSSLVGDYTAAGGDSYAGGPQRGSNYGTPQSYHPYRR